MKLAIIPARGGSKRIKNKNIIDFCGKPLISYALEAARTSQLFDKIHVSTDDLEIKDVAESLGFAVDFLRDPKLADDFTGIIPVLKWVMEEYERRGQSVSEITLIAPAAPLIIAEDLKSAYDSFVKGEKKYPCMACSVFPSPIEWAFVETPRKTLMVLDEKKLYERSQDLPKHFFSTGSFYFFRDDHVRNGIGAEFIPYILPAERAVDINEPEDLRFAKILYKGQYGEKSV